jgi:hypothetical protein
VREVFGTRRNPVSVPKSWALATIVVRFEDSTHPADLTSGGWFGEDLILQAFGRQSRMP